MKNIYIPEKLGEIKLSSYQSYLKALDDDMQPDEMNFTIVSHLCTYDEGAVDLLSIRELRLVAEQLKRLINEHTEVIYRFKFNGIDYGLIPDMKEITAREWTNIMQFLDNDEFGNLHHALSILYRPIVKEQFGRYQLDGNVYDEARAEAFKSLGMDIVQGVMLFFSKIIMSYSKYSKDYLQMKEASQTQKPSDSVGTT